MDERTLNALAFVPEEVKEYANIDDALTNLTPFLKQRQQIDTERVSFEFNGNATFKIDGQTHKTTKYGLQSFCRMLRIPDPFAKAIPLDLLQQNINRLSSFLTEVDVVLNVNNEITGFVPRKYRPLETLDLFNGLQEVFKEQTIENFRAVLGTTNSIITYTSEVFPRLEPIVGDVTQVGVEVTNSEVKDLDASAGLFLYRLICSNGVSMGSQWGRASRSKDAKLSYESMFSRFIRQIKDFRTNADALSGVYKELPNISLNSKEFVKIFGALQRGFGSDTALGLINLEKEDAKEIYQFEKDRTNWRATGNLDKFGMHPRDTELNAFDVFNKITAFGRDLKNTKESRRARAIGGHMVTMLYEERVKA